MTARIAAAKQYKQAAGESIGSTAADSSVATAVSDQQQEQQQQAAEMEQRRAAWEAEMRQRERAARGDGTYSALVAQIESGGQKSADGQQGGPDQPAR